MNQKILDSIGDAIKRVQEEIELTFKSNTRLIKAQKLFTDHNVNPTGDFAINAYGGSFWIDVHSREDLQEFMKVAQVWQKDTGSGCLIYTADVNDVHFRISAYDGALPGTCKLVERDVIIPATEERVEKRVFVECAKPVEQSSNQPINEPSEQTQLAEF